MKLDIEFDPALKPYLSAAHRIANDHGAAVLIIENSIGGYNLIDMHKVDTNTAQAAVAEVWPNGKVYDVRKPKLSNRDKAALVLFAALAVSITAFFAATDLIGF